jgi:hypothetical protein
MPHTNYWLMDRTTLLYRRAFDQSFSTSAGKKQSRSRDMMLQEWASKTYTLGYKLTSLP